MTDDYTHCITYISPRTTSACRTETMSLKKAKAQRKTLKLLGYKAVMINPSKHFKQSKHS